MKSKFDLLRATSGSALVLTLLAGCSSTSPQSSGPPATGSSGGGAAAIGGAPTATGGDPTALGGTSTAGGDTSTTTGGDTVGGSDSGGTSSSAGNAGTTQAGSSGDGGSGGSGGSGGQIILDSGSPPGDICNAAGTPLVAAHSMTRAFFKAYTGKLFQVRRASDGKTQDISVVSAGGLVDVNALNTFLSGTTGSVSMLYDQTGNGNDLPQTAAGSQPTIQFYTTGGGKKMPMAVSAPRQYLRNRDKTSKIPTGAQAQTEYFVVNAKIYNDKCCYDYGNMESKKISDGNGTMNALNIGLTNSGFSTPGAGSGPWGLVDFESGVYSAPTRIKVQNPKSPSMTWDVAFVLSKDNGTTQWTLKVSDATQGPLTVVTNAGLPPGGYNPLRQEGGLSLGEGGDGSAAGIGAFFEGVVIAAMTSDATDDAIQANLNSVYGK